jgi:hypothetical protein
MRFREWQGGDDFPLKKHRFGLVLANSFAGLLEFTVTGGDLR